jgi:hypothetical protein
MTRHNFDRTFTSFEVQTTSSLSSLAKSVMQCRQSRYGLGNPFLIRPRHREFVALI